MTWMQSTDIPEDQLQRVRAVVEALCQQLHGQFDRLPESSDFALSFDPVREGE